MAKRTYRSRCQVRTRKNKRKPPSQKGRSAKKAASEKTLSKKAGPLQEAEIRRDNHVRRSTVPERHDYRRQGRQHLDYSNDGRQKTPQVVFLA